MQVETLVPTRMIWDDMSTLERIEILQEMHIRPVSMIKRIVIPMCPWDRLPVDYREHLQINLEKYMK